MNKRVVVWVLAMVLSIPAIRSADESTGLIPPSPSEECRSAVVMECSSGEIIFEQNGRERLAPASMTKMMLVLIAMDRVTSGDLAMNDPITVSARASKMGGSQVYLAHNEIFPFEELMKAVIIQSANDASVAIAEHIGGSVEGFVDMMNAMAVKLGLEETTYQTPHGLPPGKDQEPDLTSARDLAVLARELIMRHPEILKWSCLDTEPFRDGKFLMTNTNRLIKQFAGCDGLKTGYYRSAGFCVTATAEQDGVRIITVVMGCEKGKTRFSEAARLMKWGLLQYRKMELIRAGTPCERAIPVVAGELVETTPVTVSSVAAVVRRDRMNEVIMKTTLDRELTAPVQTGQTCGTIAFLLGDHEIGRTELQTAEAIPALGWWGKLMRAVGL
ncbi:D-alanyl-D-alanine carboxypeptidase [bacterium]|nr:D-alanyl-D-alanine carboxypeptidase [candidate division CSSED10-310 bacterium]